MPSVIRRFSLLLLLALLGGALLSPGAALAAGRSDYSLTSLTATTECTSPDPAVCLIRDMTPQEREKAREIRIQYRGLLDRMKLVQQEMRADGRSDEDIARVMVDMRNEAKDITRAGMTEDAVATLEERNIQKYGNPLGPTANQLYAKYGSWTKVIEASTRSNAAVDQELGLEPHN